MRLSKIFVPITLVCLVLSPVVAQGKQPVSCNFQQETASELKKTIALNSMGIKFKIPVNYRAISKKDGSIKIVDNGTYQLMQCFAKHPNAGGGTDDFYSIDIYKSRTNYLYSNVANQVPNKPNFFIVWVKQEDNNVTFHTVKIRIKTKKGIVEVATDAYGEGPITSNAEAEKKVREMMELAQDINIS